METTNNPTMDIYSSSGTKVEFAYPDAGYPEHQKMATKHLILGAQYTIDRTEVESWNTKVYLKEFPDIAFNSVHFKRLELNRRFLCLVVENVKRKK